MDAIVGMEGNGPTHGSPRHVGAILASRSCTALDYVAASLVGIDPGTIPTCALAAARGIGPSSPGEVGILGDGTDLTCAPFALPESYSFGRVPRPLIRVARRLFASRPAIDPSVCVRCGRCAENCPPGAIAWTPGALPAIDANACIGCFCCQELCPAGAVGVHRPLARRFVG
jgi:Pyruvate/2-oxoacid:ferredoxin oxidoreductase delta subunit